MTVCTCLGRNSVYIKYRKVKPEIADTQYRPVIILLLPILTELRKLSNEKGCQGVRYSKDQLDVRNAEHVLLSGCMLSVQSSKDISLLQGLAPGEGSRQEE